MQRLKYMVENSEASALISGRSLWAKNSFNYPADKIIFIEDISEDRNFNYTAEVNQDSTAMSLYTSGTTGQPKGGAINLAPKSAREDIEFLYQFLRHENISNAFRTRNNDCRRL